MVKMTLFIILCCLAAPLSAERNPPAAYALSDYPRIITDNQTLNTSDGYLTACETGVAYGGYHLTGQEAVTALHMAYRDCVQSLTLEPNNVDAIIALGIVLAFEGKRTTSIFKVKKSKAQFEQAIKLAPGHIRAYAALAGWHSEVSHKGFFARLALGASYKKSARYFKMAIALNSNDITIVLEYARYLARRKSKQRPLAIAQLDTIIDKPAVTLLRQTQRQRAIMLKTTLLTGSKKQIKKATIESGMFLDLTDWDHIVFTN